MSYNESTDNFLSYSHEHTSLVTPLQIIEESLGWRTFIHVIWSKGQNNENINKNQCILKQRSPESIYTGIIKNTFGSYILKNY
jgi:hypothetical protein